MVGGWKFMEKHKIEAEAASGMSEFTPRRARKTKPIRSAAKHPKT
jgi:hypothetical protein